MLGVCEVSEPIGSHVAFSSVCGRTNDICNMINLARLNGGRISATRTSLRIVFRLTLDCHEAAAVGRFYRTDKPTETLLSLRQASAVQHSSSNVTYFFSFSLHFVKMIFCNLNFSNDFAVSQHKRWTQLWRYLQHFASRALSVEHMH